MSPQEFVRRRYPNSGAQLSATWGWQIMDYTDQHNPILLGRASRSESDAWVSASKKIMRAASKHKRR